MQPLIVCGNEHRFLIAEQLREVGVTPLGILLEPVGRHTAPAVAAAANFIIDSDPDAVLLVLPADHVIDDIDGFYQLILDTAAIATDGALLTFGIVPTSPHIGHSYIAVGKSLSETPPSFQVESFVEKPDHATAESFIASGSYFWNSGMFLFKAHTYLEELEKYQPAIASASQDAVKNGQRDLDFLRLDKTAFEACAFESIDSGIMQKSPTAVVIPASIGWSDISSWSALWEVAKRDENGNACQGDIFLDNVKNSLIRAENRCVAVIGLENIVVIETSDAVLVMDKDHAQRVQQVVSHLKNHERSEHIHHKRVYRPWGSYEGIDIGQRFQVKRITVHPGRKLSLQMHHHRAEHWIVVSGTARVTCGEKVSLLTENQSTYIPIGMTHRLENPGKQPLHLIEVQSGSYLGEDDIVRFEDIYQRI